jgi:phospholipid/cholesterol/gamma-HCH transport system substrate-binding protein
VSVRADAIRVAIFLLIGLVTGVLLLATLGQYQLDVPHRAYSALFTDVSALKSGDLVRVAGVRVGQVTDVSLRTDDTVQVAFTVDDTQPVMTNTRALVRYKNLIGDRYLELAPMADSPTSPAKPLPAGGVIPIGRTEPALDLNVLLGGFKPLFQGLQPQQINELASNIVKTLQGQGGTVQSLLARTASLTGTLADRDQVIGQLVTNLNVVLTSLDNRDGQLSDTVSRLQQLITGLSQDRHTIGDSLARINGFSADLAGLLDQARPPLRDTVDQLGRTAQLLDDNRSQLEAALHDIPEAHLRLQRAGSYMSAFNFFLCEIQIKTTGPTGQTVYSPVIGSNNNTPRCKGQ